MKSDMIQVNLSTVLGKSAQVTLSGMKQDLYSAIERAAVKAGLNAVPYVHGMPFKATGTKSAAYDFLHELTRLSMPLELV